MKHFDPAIRIHLYNLIFQINEDVCQFKICSNNAICEDHVNWFKCKCTGTWCGGNCDLLCNEGTLPFQTDDACECRQINEGTTARMADKTQNDDRSNPTPPPISNDDRSTPTPPPKSNINFIIIGAVVGTLVVVIIIAGAIICTIKTENRNVNSMSTSADANGSLSVQGNPPHSSNHIGMAGYIGQQMTLSDGVSNQSNQDDHQEETNEHYDNQDIQYFDQLQIIFDRNPTSTLPSNVHYDNVNPNPNLNVSYTKIAHNTEKSHNIARHTDTRPVPPPKPTKNKPTLPTVHRNNIPGYANTRPVPPPKPSKNKPIRQAPAPPTM